ncbi:MAG: MoxR family ATPase [Planctomycetota bacterium]
MLETIDRLRKNISKVYVGGGDAVDGVIRCLLARGHALIEDVPGVGKTVLASAVAKSLDCTFSRVQLTPDMLPSDVLGVTIYDRQSSRFEFKRGPIFANVVLADEVNRTTPRTQTALLEAMSDGSVSIDGTVHMLAEPFVVLATQNPFEFEGTFPLPENQLDRFLLRLRLGYPSAVEESRLLELRPSQNELPDLEPVLRADEIVAIQKQVDAVEIREAMRDYIVAFSRASREHQDLRVGMSPRGSLALAQCARATAFMDGRSYVVPEDVIDNVPAVCAHRVIPRAAADVGSWDVTSGVLADVLRGLEAPV